MKSFVAVFVTILLFTGCTENQRAKQFGGTATEKLPPGKKLITATWKENNVWVLTRDMRPDEEPETYSFQEKSSFGLIEGTVIFEEVAK